MTLFHVSKQAKFNNLLQSIYVTESLNEFRQATLHGLKEIVPFESAAFFLIDDVDFLEPYSINLSEETFTQYKYYYEPLDLYKDAVLSQTWIPPIDRSSDYLNYYQWQKNEHRVDFLMRQDIYHLACIQVFDGAKLAGMVSLHRNRKQADFSEEEMQILLLLSSHLSRAFSKHAYFGQIDIENGVIDEILKLTNASVLVLDNKLDLIYANPLAMTNILNKGSVNNTHMLLNYLKSVCTKMLHMEHLPGTWAMTTYFPGLTGRRSFRTLMHIPIGKIKPQFIIYESYGAQEILFCSESPDKELSYKEREIAKLIVCGKSNQEIAGTLSVSLNTIKTHVRNILHKLDARNRTELLARIISKKTDS